MVYIEGVDIIMDNVTWISTNDKLPELIGPYDNCSEDVLILLNDGTCAVACRVYEGDTNQWWMNSDERTDYRIEAVKYWRPLPELPDGMK